MIDQVRCLTSLSAMGTAFNRLSPKESAQVQGLFITVDPERDNAETVAAYARHFHLPITGLTGNLEAVEQVAKRYSVVFRKVPLTNSGLSYAVNHSSVVYLVGRDGVIHSRVHLSNDAKVLEKNLRLALAN